MSGNSDSVGGSRLTGDGNPTLFDFYTLITEEELLDLYIVNPHMEKAIKFVPTRLMAAGWEFKEEGPFSAEKHGKPYTYESFTDWIKWNGLYQEIIYAMCWALLFRRARIFFYLPEEVPGLLEGKPYFGPIEPGTAICTKAIAMYSLMRGNGWKIWDEDPITEEPLIYEIHTTNNETKSNLKKRETKIHYVHASRCVEFTAPKKELGMEGTAKAHTIAHLCRIQHLMLQSVFVQAKNLIAGYIIYRSKNQDESTAINKLLEKFSHLTRIGWSGQEPLEDVLKLIVPEFNVNQMAEMNLLMNKALGSAMNISIRNLGEEDIASGLGEGGAGISHEITAYEIEDLQMHFQRAVERCFYLMGKTESTFVWNQPNADEELREEQKEQEKEESDTEVKDNGKKGNEERD